MTDETNKSIDSRRRFLGATAAGLTLGAFGSGVGAIAADSDEQATKPRTVRDKFWIFTCFAGADNGAKNFPGESRMTPAEGAFYLGTPNLMLIRCGGKPPLDQFEQYAIPFRPLKRLVWSIVGSGGRKDEGETQAALDLALRSPNMVGLFMDDFFHADGSGKLAPQQLKELKKRMVIDGRKLDLYVVLYRKQLGLPVAEHLKYCDKITYWTWHSKNLENLEQDFGRLEKLAPDHGKLLGCYLWDFGGQGPMPVDRMKLQCELGLRWLREGKIEGMIFLANTMADLGLDAVEWTRKWIAEVGDEPI